MLKKYEDFNSLNKKIIQYIELTKNKHIKLKILLGAAFISSALLYTNNAYASSDSNNTVKTSYVSTNQINSNINSNLTSDKNVSSDKLTSPEVNKDTSNNTVTNNSLDNKQSEDSNLNKDTSNNTVTNNNLDNKQSEDSNLNNSQFNVKNNVDNSNNEDDVSIKSESEKLKNESSSFIKLGNDSQQLSSEQDGFKTIDGKYYYYKNGVLQVNQWEEEWGNTYYTDNNGIAVQGFQNIGGNQYYFGNDNTYYLRKNQNIDLGNGNLDYANNEGIVTPLHGYIDNKWYDNGQLYTGFANYYNKYYYFKDGIRQEHQWIYAYGLTYHTDNEGVAMSGFQTINSKHYYFGNDNTYYLRTNQFFNDENKTYYSNNNGELIQGLQTIDGKMYYFGDDGTYNMRTNQASLDLGAGNTIKIDGNGVVTPLHGYIDNKWYENGQLYTGFATYYGKYYYFKGGIRQDNQWVNAYGLTYHTDNEGVAMSGLQTIDGKMYYFGDDGTYNMRTNQASLDLGAGNTIKIDGNGVVTPLHGYIDNKWYENGQLYTGFATYYNKYYYFKDGIRQDNQWVNAYGLTYHTDNEGVAMSGLQTIDGKMYYFGDDGTYNMRTNQASLDLGAGNTIKIDGNGVVTPLHGYIDNKWYENGQLYTGFATYYDKYYYFKDGIRQDNQWVNAYGLTYHTDNEGVAMSGFQTIDGKMYYFGDDGTYNMRTNQASLDLGAGNTIKIDGNGVVTPLHGYIDNKWYENGQLYTGFATYYGKYYYFKDGIRQDNQWVYAFGLTYHTDNEGVAMSGFQTIDGKLYNFGDDGTYYMRNLYVSANQLLQLGWVGVTDKMVEGLNNCLIKFGITTKARICHFLSQCSEESGAGKWTEELGSGEEYNGRTDLGNIYPGDGVKYKGAGYIQTTGRSNYAKLADFMGDSRILSEGASYVAANYPWASAGFWWYSNGMNALCDAGASVAQVTKRVNGGYNGLSEREYYYNKCLSIFG